MDILLLISISATLKYNPRYKKVFFFHLIIAGYVQRLYIVVSKYD